MAKKVVIASAVRTPIGKNGGALKSKSAVDLGIIAAKEAIKRAGVKPEDIDEGIIGCVLQAGLGQNVGRQIVMGAGCPKEVPGMTLNIVCGSGLRTVSLAMSEIIAGEADIVLTGGTESMSNAPYLIKNMRWGSKMGDKTIYDSMLSEGLHDVFHHYHMGITAENIAERFNITRREQDEISAVSQQRACAARASGRFKDEIVPVEVTDRKGNVTIVDADEGPRENVTADSIAKLRPVFKEGGTVTAANASGINDGASMLVIMSEDKAKELGIKPLATIVSAGTAGVDPAIMGTGPIPASKKALKKAGLTIEDMDLVEANEAFASQTIICKRELNLDMDKTNVNGGAIALGHPVGASGARILTTLLYEMQKRDSHYGLATLCIGGGMGTALVVEREK